MADRLRKSSIKKFIGRPASKGLTDSTRLHVYTGYVKQKKNAGLTFISTEWTHFLTDFSGLSSDSPSFGERTLPYFLLFHPEN